MPMPQAFAVLPKYLNPLMRRLAPYIPPLAVIHHRGRRSGTSYASPVQAYRVSDGFLIGLAYTSNPNWARNIIASGGEITRLGKTYRVSNPQMRGAEAADLLPKPVALMMRGLGITEFFQCEATPTVH